jgi:phospho-N-acetylmuramoyl-pentapeptide-transferase
VIALLVAAAVSMVFTLLLTPLFAQTFRRLKLGQFIRADTPTTHVVKRGTPSMGGLVFITAAVFGYFVGKFVAGERPSSSALLVILMMVGLGAVGFLDDFLKVRRKNSLGLRGPYKIVGSTIVAVIFSVLALNHRDGHGMTAASAAISFVRDINGLNLVTLFGAGLGLVILTIWFILITTATSNAVNLADGLDGLAAGASIFAIGSYVVIGFWQNKQSCFGLLSPTDMAKCYDVSQPLELAVIAAAIVGAVMGFLWWNTSPAQITMGDTGSFGLGGALAALAILSRTELLLVLVGGLFLIVTGQVIIQRIYFKATKGKRIWRASPLHHHFEMKGWPEVTIVVRFWIISGLFVSAAIGIFYIEWVLRN